MKSVRIGRFSGPYSVQMGENTDQKNSEYRRFSRSEHHIVTNQQNNILIELKDIKIRNILIDENTVESLPEIYCSKFFQSVNSK